MSRSMVQGARIVEALVHDSKLSFGYHNANATLTLTAKHPMVMEVDPVGTDGRKVLMPLVATANRGKVVIIINAADAAESIAVKDSTDATTFATVAQGEAVVMVQGTTWYGLVGANT